MNLTDRARRYISKMEPAIAGSGGHDRTFAAASILISGFAFDREAALTLLREWNGSHCNPEWNERDLIHKIESAISAPSSKPYGYLVGEKFEKQIEHGAPSKAPPAWPIRDHERIAELLETSFVSLRDLEALSPLNPGTIADPYAVIDHLFISPQESNPLLCLAKDIKTPATRRRSDWQGHIERAQYIVPNPMTAPTGKTQANRESVRCLDNTGQRRFLVVECDFTEESDRPLFEQLSNQGASVADLCSTVLCRLAEFAPLVMAVHSGGKSLHGWFSVLNQSETDLKQFMRWACLYGADKATWTRCQLVRLPCSTRDNGNPQSVHYFNADRALVNF